MVEAPSGIFYIDRKLVSGEVRRHWYARGRRGALPEPNTPEWFAALAEISGKPARRPGVFTVEDLWDSYRASPRWPKRESTQRIYESRYRVHVRPSFGASAVSSITAKHLVELRDSRASVPATANMILIVLGMMWTRAIEIGEATINIPDSISRLDEEPDEAKPVSPEAWAALISPAAPEALRRFAYLARGTGQRISDVVMMTPAMREDGKDESGIRHAIKKTGKKRNIKDHWSPVRAEYLAIIDAWRTWPTRPYVRIGDDAVNEHAIRHLWRKFAKTDEGKALAGFTPHDLRATCVCDDRLSGHDTLQIVSRRAMSPGMVLKYSRYIDQKSAAQVGAKSA